MKRVLFIVLGVLALLSTTALAYTNYTKSVVGTTASNTQDFIEKYLEVSIESVPVVKDNKVSIGYLNCNSIPVKVQLLNMEDEAISETQEIYPNDYSKEFTLFSNVSEDSEFFNYKCLIKPSVNEDLNQVPAVVVKLVSPIKDKDITGARFDMSVPLQVVNKDDKSYIRITTNMDLKIVKSRLLPDEEWNIVDGEISSRINGKDLKYTDLKDVKVEAGVDSLVDFEAQTSKFVTSKIRCLGDLELEIAPIVDVSPSKTKLDCLDDVGDEYINKSSGTVGDLSMGESTVDPELYEMMREQDKRKQASSQPKEVKEDGTQKSAYELAVEAQKRQESTNANVSTPTEPTEKKDPYDTFGEGLLS